MEKVTEKDIDFLRERKNVRLWKEYYFHRENSINDLLDLKKNMELARDLTILLKDNPEDIELIHSKKVVLDYCFEKYKNIKKEDLESVESEKRINNIRVSKTEEVKQDETDYTSNNFHEDVKLILKKYNESKEC